MAIYGLVILSIGCACYCTLNAINRGWLIDKGQKTVQVIRTLCEIIGILSIVALLTGVLLIKIL